MVARQRLDQPGAITGIARRLRSAERAAPLGFSSITRGGMRVESAEGIRVNTVAGGAPGLYVTGLELVDGTLRITGRLEGGGTFVWTGSIDQIGSTTLRGPVAITGQTGTLTVDAETLLRGLTRVLADLRVEQNGKIKVGNMVIDPTDGGSVTFPGGAVVQADTAQGGVQMRYGANKVYVGPTLVSVQYGAKSIAMTNSAITVQGVAERSSVPSGMKWLGLDGNELVWVANGTGGPMGGPLQWPFPPSTVSSEFGPRESPGGVGSTNHLGIDFGVGEGTPIPSCAAGTVELAGWNGGFGNCVILNHGGGLKTLYAHMSTLPVVTVGQTVAAKQTLGPVGNTGQSDGAHLHLEVHVNSVPVNPRSKLTQQI